MTHSLAESLDGGSPTFWAYDFLVAADMLQTEENLRAVVSWEWAESGDGGGMWNPLNTTQGGYPGETNANSVGVKNYARREDGIAANAKVIRNGLYGPVVRAFEVGNNAEGVIGAIIASPWGTKHIVLVPPLGPQSPQPHPPTPKAATMPAIISNGHGGYWVVHADGAVFALGGAEYHGGLNPGGGATMPAGQACTGGAGSPTGKGYWLISSGGNVYAFGDAVYHGGAPTGTP